jgi:hypothetical protein
VKAYGWLGVAAAALLVVGLVFGFAPVKSGGYDCGSAFHRSSSLDVQQFTRGETSDCDAARSDRQPIAWAAIAVAALLGGVAFVMSAGSGKESKPGA